MALTVFDLDAAPPARLQGGEQGLRMVVKRITFDNSYPTGGEALTAADLGLADTTIVVVQPAAGYVFAYDYDNDKVLAYRSGASGSAFAQVGNTVDLSAVTTQVIAIGTPSANE